MAKNLAARFVGEFGSRVRPHSLKGCHTRAQGNALGNRDDTHHVAPTGQHNGVRLVVCCPVGATISSPPNPQGDALGYRVMAFQARGWCEPRGKLTGVEAVVIMRRGFSDKLHDGI